MRVVIAPDALAGLLPAAQVAEAIAAGWRAAAPNDLLSLVPLTDGGLGFAEVMELHAGSATAPEPATTYVDGAGGVDATGSSAELGRVIGDALARGARRVVVGLGSVGDMRGISGRGMPAGSDGGYDALRELGARRSSIGEELDLAPALAALVGVELVIATDVDDQASAVPVWLPGTARTLAGRDGAGALADLGLALLAVGARRVNAAQLAIDAAALGAVISSPGVAGLVVTGERVVGWHSRRGRVLAGVARTAVQFGAPVVALCADVQVGRRETANLGIEAVYPIAPALSPPTTPGAAAASLTATATRVARTWSRADLP